MKEIESSLLPHKAPGYQSSSQTQNWTPCTLLFEQKPVLVFQKRKILSQSSWGSMVSSKREVQDLLLEPHWSGLGSASLGRKEEPIAFSFHTPGASSACCLDAEPSAEAEQPSEHGMHPHRRGWCLLAQPAILGVMHG